jgi:HKD family nuclease
MAIKEGWALRMPDTTISFVDQPLQTLLKTRIDYPGANLDLSVAYISAIGVAWLQPLFKSAKQKRVIVGASAINRVGALEALRELGVEVYVYVTRPGTIFHPKIYYGSANSAAWAMIGSSNLTQSGLSLNVERNLFITGQRVANPFTSIEMQLESFRSQSYIFDDIKDEMVRVEGRTKENRTDEEYIKILAAFGVKPKVKLESVIPNEIVQLSIEAIFDLAKNAILVHAYQMLLLLVLLKYAKEGNPFLIEDAANCFIQFYRLRVEAGLPAELNRGSKIAEVNKPKNFIPSKMGKIIMIDPFPRFERRGLLDVSEDKKYFIINPALLEALTPSNMEELRSIAIRQLAKYFREDATTIEAMVTLAIG